MIAESPRSVFVIDLSELDPTPKIAAGMRVVLTNSRPFRIDLRGYADFDDSNEAIKAKDDWIAWLLREWTAKTIPQGRAGSSRAKQSPDATDRTNPFELLLALGVDLVDNFRILAEPDNDGQRARLIDEWCKLSVPPDAIASGLSRLSTYGPEAFRAGIECAASHRGKVEWIGPVANAIKSAPGDSIQDNAAFQSLCTGPWEVSDRETFAQALASRGGSGKVLASLLRYTASGDRVQRIQVLAQAFHDLTLLPQAILDEGEIAYDFVVAAETRRLTLHLAGNTSPEKPDSVSQEIDDAARQVSPPAAVRPVLERTRDRAKEGVRRWAFSI